MPVHCESTGKNAGYCQWGSRGKKYTYSAQSRQVAEQGKKAAMEAAQRQGRAAYANGYRG